MPLAAHNLSFSYTPSKPILRDLSLSFAPARITAILGPNGAGKSTLLRLLLALRTPTSGRITLGGRDIADMPRADRAARLAYIPQSSSLAFPFSVRQVVRTGLFSAPGPSSPGRARDRATDDALRRLNLLDLADQPFGLLSAGQQQRVTIARALAQLTVPNHESGGAGCGAMPLPPALVPPIDESSSRSVRSSVPPIGERPAMRASRSVSPPGTPSSSAARRAASSSLNSPHNDSTSPLPTSHSALASPRALLADEPISALDPQHALAALSLFRELARSGLIVILVLHDLPTAVNHADDAVLLDAGGSLAAAGPVRDCLTPDNLQRVFSVPFERVRSDSGLTSALLPVDPSTLARTGSPSS